jgi:hypothetical protein
MKCQRENRSPPETRRPPARRRVRQLVHDGEVLNRLRIIARERVADPRPDIVAHHRVTFVAQLSHERVQIGRHVASIVALFRSARMSPRGSTAMARKPDVASAGMMCRRAYQVWGHPGIKSTGGPSLPSILISLASPVSTIGATLSA